MFNRRAFVKSSGIYAIAGGAISLGNQQETEQEKTDKKEDAAKKPDGGKPRQLDSSLVNQFVGRSHGNLKAVKEMLAKEPMLVYATWDWADGDFETGLNAASHVGRRPIAEFLLEKGARLDVCAAVMLGMKGVVGEMLKVNPDLHQVKGAHQIPMLHHAIRGRDQADGVLELLLDSGADVNGGTPSNHSPLMAAASVGRVPIVEMLIKRGANINAKNSTGQTALDVATKSENEDVVKFLTPLMKAD